MIAPLKPRTETSSVWRYRCPRCGAEYPIEPGRYLCDPCAAANAPGLPLLGVLECVWDAGATEGFAKAYMQANTQPYSRDGIPTGSGPATGSGSPAALGPSASILSRIPFPVESRWFPPIPVGDTPLWRPERLRSELGFPKLYLKDDTCNPSGSFKDRASFLVAAFARAWGIREIALASTGNAASSMAALGAAAGLDITVFLPASAPAAKRIQVLQYGADLREVKGTYDQAFEESLAYSRETGVLSRNTAYNPLTIEGKKSVSYEIFHDLGNTVPDHIFVPTGDGVIIAGVIRGFENLIDLGLARRMPRVWAAQAAGSSALARALAAAERGAPPFGSPEASSTLADSISVDVPRNGWYALEKLRAYGGQAVVVEDAEILDAQRFVSARSGLFAEPSSACAFAGFLKVRRSLSPEESVVVMLTGSGLKDVRSAALGVGAAM